MANPKDYTNIPKMGEVKKSQLDSSELFLIVNVEDKYRIALANNWVSKREFDTPEQAEYYIQDRPWELIMNCAGVIAQFAIKEAKEIEQNNK